MSKFALSRCVQLRNPPLTILLLVLWRDYEDFSFFRLRVVVGQTVSSIFFFHLVSRCVLRLLCYCVRVRFDGRGSAICDFLF
jgi:hypothetical protein